MATKSFNVDILLNVIQTGKSALGNLDRELTSLFSTAQAGTREFALLRRALVSLNRPIGGKSAIKELIDQVDLLKAGIIREEDFVVKISAGKSKAELTAIVNTVKSIVSALEGTNNVQAFGFAADVLDNLRKVSGSLRKVIDENDDLVQSYNKQTAELKVQTREIDNQVKVAAKRFKELKSAGEVTKEKPQLLASLDSEIKKLEDIKEKLTGLGETTNIDIQIANAKKVRDAIAGYKSSLDDLAKERVEFKVLGSDRLKEIRKELDFLVKKLQEAEQYKDLKLVVKIETQRKELESELKDISDKASALGDAGIGRQASEAQVRVKNFGNQVSNVSKNIPKGISGYFKNLASSVGDAGKALSQSNGILRATSGSLRLVGTSAFLVGGQFRTLGFAASAFGNIIQTYGPVISQLVATLGPLAPLFLAIGAAIAASVVQFAAFGVALVAIIDTGFKFNDQFSKVQNSVSAVAREFFTFSSATTPAATALGSVASAAQTLELSGKAVGKELEALQFEATQTEFTAQDLFEAFQSTTSALGNLSPSLEDSRKLTGLFARTASIARVPISQLGSSISQIIAGTGRITNPLVRDVFNKLKDSEGIALTAKRIRELRAEGGTKLFDEITLALSKFTAGVGELQATKTLSGAFSNIQDLFQIFSGRATKSGFDEVVQSLVKVRDAIVTVDKTTQDINFTPSFQKLLDITTAFINRLSGDFSSVVESLTKTFENLGTYVESNYDYFVDIYETSKLIFVVIKDIIVDFVEFIGLAQEGSATFAGIRFILGGIAAILAGIRGSVNGVYLITLVTLRVVTTIIEGLGKVVTFLTQDAGLENWAKSAGDSLDKNIGNRVEDLINSGKQLGKSLSLAFSGGDNGGDLARARTKKTGDEEVTTTPNKTTKKEEDSKRASQRSLLNLREEYKQFYNSLFDLSAQYNALSLDQARKSIQRQQDIITAKVELGLKSEIEAQNEIQALRLQDLDNEINSRQAALATSRRKQIADEKANKLVLDAIREAGTDQEKADSLNKSKQRVVEGLKQVQQSNADIKKAESEILDLEYEKLKVSFEYLKNRTQILINLRKESAELAASVASLRYPNTFIEATAKFSSDIQNLAERYTKINEEIDRLSKSSNTLEQVDQKRLDNLKQIRGLLLTQLALRQQQETFNGVQLVAERELNNLAREQSALQREIDFGRISTEAGQTRIIKLNYEYSKALQAVLIRLRQLNAEEPNLDRTRQIQELERTIQDLGDTITESTLLSASNNLRDNLVDTFVRIQENAGNAVDAVKSFASSVLGTFRRLLAEKIVKDLFKTLFPEPGQTRGRAGGLFASLFRSLGLEPTTAVQQEVDKAGPNAALENRITEALKSSTVFGSLDERVKSITASLDAVSKEYLDSINPVVSALKTLEESAKSVPTVLSRDFFEKTLDNILVNFGSELGKGVSKVTGEVVKELRQYFRDVLGVNLPGTNETATSTGSGAVSGTSGGGTGTRRTGGRIGSGGRSSRSGGFQPEQPSAADMLGPDGKPVSPEEAAKIAAQRDKDSGKTTGYEIPSVALNEGRRSAASQLETNQYGRGGALFSGTSNIINVLADKFKGRTEGAQLRDYRSQRLNEILGSGTSKALTELLPEEVFSQLSQSRLEDFSLSDKIDQFVNIIDDKFSQAYYRFNNLARGDKDKSVLAVVGSILNAKGNYDQQALPVIAKVGASDILKRIPGLKDNPRSTPIFLANIASQILSDIESATSTVKEIEAITNSKLNPAKAELNSNKEKAKQSPEASQRMQESIRANEEKIKAAEAEIAAKTANFKRINLRLATLSYSKTDRKDVAKYLNRVQFKAAGGAVFGKGGPTSDSIPAMLSNGEYVVNAKTVKKLGVPFFDRLNNVKEYADGGKLIDTLYTNPAYSAPAVDTSKFNYFGGAASLIRAAAPILEPAAKKAEPQKRKKRGIFGSILSAIAPFLNFIPILGPFLSLGAGALGGALSGSEKGVAGGILGGIFGGLSNLGGFSGSKGFMGSLSKFFGEGGKGAPILGLLGMSGAGNLGNTIGQGFYGLTNQLLNLPKFSFANSISPQSKFSGTSVRDILKFSFKDGITSGPSFNKNNIADMLKRYGLERTGIKFAEGGAATSTTPAKKGGFFSSLLGSLLPVLLAGSFPALSPILMMLPFLAPLLSKSGILGGLLGGGGAGGGGGIGGIFGSIFGIGGGKTSLFEGFGGILSSLFGKKMATGGIVPSGPKTSNISSGIIAAAKKLLAAPPTALKSSGIFGAAPKLLSEAAKISEGIAKTKLPDLSKLNKDSFRIIAQKGGWKIGFGKAVKFAKGGSTVNLPIVDTSYLSKYFTLTGGSGSSGGSGGSGSGWGQLIGPLIGLGSTFLPGLLNKTPKEPDYSIQDPDAARKNRYGSAYDALVEYGIIGEYKYQKETLDALRRGSKWRPIQRPKSNIGGVLSSILPMLFSAASGFLSKSATKKAGGGMVVGPGTGTSDSIPAWLSSGEYVIKASSVRNLGTDILDSINDGRFKFAKGGVAGEGVNTLPQIDFSSTSTTENPVTVNNNTKVVNVLDPNLLGDYLQTNEGTKTLINLISKRSREIKSILER